MQWKKSRAILVTGRGGLQDYDMSIDQPCSTRRPRAAWGPRYAFLAPSVSTLFEPIININSNFKTKNVFECLSTVKYFHKMSLKHGTVLDIL
jgi:hypothetical protein